MPSQADIDAYQALVTTIRANANYEANGSTAEAEAFAGAMREMLALYPERAQSGGSAGEFYQFDRETQLELLRQADEFVRQGNIAAGGATRYWRLCGRSA